MNSNFHGLIRRVMSTLGEIRRQRKELNKKFNAFHQSTILPNDIVNYIKNFVYYDIPSSKQFKKEIEKSKTYMYKTISGGDTFYPRFLNGSSGRFSDIFPRMYSQMGVSGRILLFPFSSKVKRIPKEGKGVGVKVISLKKLMNKNKELSLDLALRKSGF